MKTLRLILLTLPLVNIWILDAQIIPFDNYSVLNGLPSNVLYDIEQDDQGYLWLATQVGLVKFDGYNFTTFTTEDGLPDNNISDIFIDSQDRMWIATENGGLAVREGNNIKQITENEGLVSNNSIKVFEDYTGNIWYVSYNGISRINNDSIENFGVDEGFSGEVYAMYAAMDSSVWFATFENIHVYSNGKLKIFEKEIFSGSIVRDIVEDSKGSYWFATQNAGVIHITGSKIVHFDTNGILPSNVCLDVTVLDSNEIMIGTSYPVSIAHIKNDSLIRIWDEQLEGEIIWEIYIDSRKRGWIRTHENGIFLFKQNSIQHISEANGLRDNQPTKLFEDRNGNLWIATFNGLSKYGKILFEQYNEGLLNQDKNIQSIASSEDKIYAGSYSGLNIIHNNKVRNVIINPDGTPSNPDVVSILSTSNNELWLGTYNGLTKFDRGITHHFADTVFGGNNNMVECAFDIKEHNDTLWCATGVGLISFTNGKYSLYSVKNGLPENHLWAIDIDQDGNIWCATVAGLSVFDGQNFHNYNKDDGLPHDYCNDITIADDGTAFIATEAGLSIVRINASWQISCQNLTEKQGLGSDNIIFSTLIDKEDYIWIGHKRGVDRIDPSDFTVTNYGQLEGFLPVETSLGAITLSTNRDIWFGTVDGAIRYMPDNDIISPDPPQIYISNITFLDDTSSIFTYSEGSDEFNLPRNLNLKYNKHNLIFEYVGIHYTIIKKNKYKYMLEGYDDNWSVPSTEITASYRRIPPGNYTFKVLAANCDGIWCTVPAEYNFRISPPFWKTKLFYIFEILLVITLLILFIRLRERKLRRDKEDLAKKVKERTIEVENQRDQIAVQKQEITDSIVYAERIQDAVLPGKNYIDELLQDYFIFFKPRDIVSGDFYWVHGSKERLTIVAADCTGHGVPGAFMSMLGISILNEIASSNKKFNAGEILDTLRDHLTSTLWQSGTDEEAKDGMDMVLCNIDFTSREVQYAGAYNSLLLVRNNELTIYKADKMPVGFHFGDMRSFTTHEFPYKKGDCLYMYSDGFADQFGGPKGKKFMTKRFRELLLTLSELPMDEQKNKLSETIQNWMGINEQVDDMLVVGIRLE